MAFELMVLYAWKPGISADRIEHHFRKIRSLNGRVPGMTQVRVGPRTAAMGKAAEPWTHAGIMTFHRKADYEAFGHNPAHDEIAPELVADLADIAAIGFETDSREA